MKYLLSTPNYTYAKLELLFLSIKEQKYLEAYQYFEHLLNIKNYKGITLDTLNNINFYLKFKLNLLTEEDIRYHKNYFCLQLLEYSDDRAIEHIRKHLDENSHKKNHTLYEQSIDVEQVFHEAQEKIKSMNPVKSALSDFYFVEYASAIGTSNGVATNQVKIVTFSNTKDILTMYPSTERPDKGIDSCKKLIKK